MTIEVLSGLEREVVNKIPTETFFIKDSGENMHFEISDNLYQPKHFFFVGNRHQALISHYNKIIEIPGLLEEVNFGSLYLKNIDLMSSSTQGKLLRILEDRKYYRASKE